MFNFCALKGKLVFCDFRYIYFFKLPKVLGKNSSKAPSVMFVQSFSQILLAKLIEVHKYK
jgi:hypothetical protein